MKANRRTFVSTGALGTAAIAAWAYFGPCGRSRAQLNRGMLLAPKKSKNGGEAFAGIVDLKTLRQDLVPIDFEGHSVVPHPGKAHHALVMPQRPGHQACEFDYAEKKVTRKFEPTAGRIMYGHGVFSPDGKQLYTTEAGGRPGEGQVIVRDGQSYEIVRELASFGAKPHQIGLLDGGKTLCVANTGEEEVVEEPNPLVRGQLHFLLPSFTLIDAQSGELLQRVRMENRFASMRHLDVGPDGTVALVEQSRSPREEPAPPLVAFFRKDSGLVLARDPGGVFERMKRHTLSVALDQKGEIAAVTSPWGNVVTFWKTASGEHVKTLSMHEPSGVTLAPGGSHFLVTSFSGGLESIRTDRLTFETVAVTGGDGAQWESHAIVV